MNHVRGPLRLHFSFDYAQDEVPLRAAALLSKACPELVEGPKGQGATIR